MYLTSDEMLHYHQPNPLVMERRWKSNTELAPNCPRCASSNTKFCYYNNYSLSQPRYFCKGCRRYWTKGGSLRNVPVGGGCRKSRRTKAVRPPHDGRSPGYVDDGSLGSGLVTSDPSSVNPQGCGSERPNIDLAVVFAKFLNHTGETGPSSDMSYSPDQDIRLEDMLAECQMQSSMTENGEQIFTGFGEEFLYGDNILQEGQTQEFSGHEPNPFGFQTMLGDELAQDLTWPDSTNIAWQPMVQLHDFGSFPCDDQFKIPTNVSDNWNLFDFPACESFQQPS